MILQRDSAATDDGNADGIHVSNSEAGEYAGEKAEGKRSASSSPSFSAEIDDWAADSEF